MNPNTNSNTNHKAKAGLHLLPDAPIEQPRSDRLDRMAFVRSFAEAVRAVHGADSVVLALAGPWGSGKSSLLNLVAHELSHDPNPPLTVRFNPWWFTGSGRLVAAFLEQLAAAVARPDMVKILGQASPLLSRLAAAIETPGGELGASTRDIEQLRAELNAMFRQSPRRILIFMDDVDRLTPEEVTQLLLIVRAVADFPQTTFVLALDHEVVSQAISNKLGVDGRTYLEKVILLQIDVPMPGRMALERMVMNQLQAIDPQAARLDEDAQRHFRILFEGGVRHFLSTPRACTRLLNVLRFSYPLLVGQVYFPDMLGVSSLISFSSQAIQAIRTSPDAFTGPCDPSGDGWVRLREYHLKWLQQLPPKDRAAVELIVRVLFPKVAWALNGPLRGPECVELWDRRQRVCSERHFDSYFRLGVSQGEASEWRWRTMVELLDDATAFARALDRYGPLGEPGTGTSVADLLQQATDYVIDQATPEQAAKLFRELLRRGDEIAAVHETRSGAKLDSMHRLVSLLIECLCRLEEPGERRERLLKAVATDAALLTAAELLDALDYRPAMFCAEGESPDHDAHTKKLMEALKQLDVRIQASADSGDLLQHPLFMRVIQKWWKFGRRTKAQSWLRDAAQSDKVFVDAILQTRPLSDLEAAAVAGDKTAGSHLALPYDFLEEILGRVELLERITRLFDEAPEWLSADARETLHALRQHIESSQ